MQKDAESNSAPGIGRPGGDQDMPGIAKENRVTTHNPTHDGDAFAPVRGRHNGDRPLAGSRKSRDDTPVRRG